MENKWYAVEYAGFWTIQCEDVYGPGYDILDAEVVGRSVAEYNAKLAASAPELLREVEQWKELAEKLYKVVKKMPYNTYDRDVAIAEYKK